MEPPGWCHVAASEPLSWKVLGYLEGSEISQYVLNYGSQEGCVIRGESRLCGPRVPAGFFILTVAVTVMFAYQSG